MYILGLDIGGTKCAAVIAAVNNGSIEFLDRYEVKTTSDWKYILGLLCAWANAKATDLGIILSSVGISCGGPLSADRKYILSPPNLYGWDKVPVVEFVEELCKTKAYLENDADACALAEYRYGAGAKSNSMIFLTFGTGFGAGIILEEKLYRGVSGMAGEIGHVRIAEDGPVGYGKEGSMEGYASGGGIARLAYSYGMRATKDKELSAKYVIEEARSGNKEALKVIATSASKLGKGLAVLVDILNPDTIVIGSIYSRAENLFKDIVDKELQKECLKGTYEAVRILPAGLSERIGDYGAICAALYHIE